MFSISPRPSSTSAPMNSSAAMSDVDAYAQNAVTNNFAHACASAAAALHVATPVLPNALWGMVADILPRDDVLSLRTTHREMVVWVDRSIRSLRVSAAKMPVMLAAIGRMRSLKHIDAVSMYLCTSKNFPAAITALAALPHAKIALRIERSIGGDTPLDAVGMASLRTIGPASLCIENYGRLTVAQALGLANLDYPVFLRLENYYVGYSADLRALADIPQLASLDVELEALGDDLAEAFGQHRNLTALRLRPIVSIALSNAAVEHLAAIPTLESLCIGATRAPLGEKAMIALSRNKGLTSLIMDTVRHPLGASASWILSQNTSLKTLSISLCDGWSHLAAMASLEGLTLHGATPITLGEASKFAQHARLRALDLNGAKFEDDALAMMISANVENLDITVDCLNARELGALLENQQLRSLRCLFTGALSDAIANVMALARHPTLASLNVWHDGAEQGRHMLMSEVERAAMLDAWGGNHRHGALQVNF